MNEPGQLNITSGTRGVWTIQLQTLDPTSQAQVPCTQFVEGDTLAATIWSGQGQPVLESPTAAWADDDPTAGLVKLTITEAQSGNLDAGRYRLRVVVNSTDGQVIDAVEAVLAVAEAPGVDEAPKVYGTYQDLLLYAPWLATANDLNADLTGFSRQRGQAREWLDAIILDHAPRYGQGLNDCHTLVNNDRYISEKLDADELLITGKVREIVARRTLALVCGSMLPTAGQDSPYEAFGRKQQAMADSLIGTYTAQLSSDGTVNKVYLEVPCNSWNGRYSTPSCQSRGCR